MILTCEASEANFALSFLIGLNKEGMMGRDQRDGGAGGPDIYFLGSFLQDLPYEDLIPQPKDTTTIKDPLLHTLSHSLHPSISFLSLPLQE